MTNAAEWTFDVYMEMRFSGKKTWFVKAVNNETGVYWVNRESFDHAPDDARELATSLQVKHGHQAAWNPAFASGDWERRGVEPTLPGHESLSRM